MRLSCLRDQVTKEKMMKLMTYDLKIDEWVVKNRGLSHKKHYSSCLSPKS